MLLLLLKAARGLATILAEGIQFNIYSRKASESPNIASLAQQRKKIYRQNQMEREISHSNKSAQPLLFIICCSRLHFFQHTHEATV